MSILRHSMTRTTTKMRLALTGAAVENAIPHPPPCLSLHLTLPPNPCAATAVAALDRAVQRLRDAAARHCADAGRIVAALDCQGHADRIPLPESWPRDVFPRRPLMLQHRLVHLVLLRHGGLQLHGRLQQLLLVPLLLRQSMLILLLLLLLLQLLQQLLLVPLLLQQRMMILVLLMLLLQLRPDGGHLQFDVVLQRARQILLQLLQLHVAVVGRRGHGGGRGLQLALQWRRRGDDSCS